MRIGILTAGGDCPGINAAIRGVALTAICNYDAEVIGFHGGFKGLIYNDHEIISEHTLPGLLSMGGTYLGTNREKPFKKTDDDMVNNKPQAMVDTVHKLGLDAIVCIGGNGTMRTASQMHSIGIPVIGIPKTIDNDIWGTDITFGFNTAVEIIAESIDRLQATASSHGRVMVVEVMGHRTGWLALHGGMAGGAHAILLPELGFNPQTLCNFLEERNKRGCRSSIVVVAEGVEIEGKNKKHPGRQIAEMIEANTGIETRETILGYTQRGGSPTSYDRNLATQMGVKAVQLAANGEFGKMVSLMGSKIASLPLSMVAGNLKTVKTDDEMIAYAKQMGVCFASIG